MTINIPGTKAGTIPAEVRNLSGPRERFETYGDLAAVKTGQGNSASQAAQQANNALTYARGEQNRIRAVHEGARGRLSPADTARMQSEAENSQSSVDECQRRADLANQSAQLALADARNWLQFVEPIGDALAAVRGRALGEYDGGKARPLPAVKGDLAKLNSRRDAIAASYLPQEEQEKILLAQFDEVAAVGSPQLLAHGGKVAAVLPRAIPSAAGRYLQENATLGSPRFDLEAVRASALVLWANLDAVKEATAAQLALTYASFGPDVLTMTASERDSALADLNAQRLALEYEAGAAIWAIVSAGQPLPTDRPALSGLAILGVLA